MSQTLISRNAPTTAVVVLYRQIGITPEVILRLHYKLRKKTGKVQWKDIEKDMYFLEFPMVRAEGFNLNSSENRAHFSGMTMKDYLRYLWNAPKRGQSPYKIFEKVLYPNGYDEDGNIVYYYNQSVTFQPSTNEGAFELKKL